LGERSTKVRLAASKAATVSTTIPEETPANFSVSAKQPSSPATCIARSCSTCDGLPAASTVPAKRLNCTVKRVQKPLPRSSP